MSVLFSEFIAECFEGNQSAAARALGVDRSQVSRLCAGDRSVTPELALRIESIAAVAGPEKAARFRKERFIWPDAPLPALPPPSASPEA